MCLKNILPPLTSNNRRIYLLRHGETNWNSLGKMQGGGFDIPLNDAGKQQAKLVAELLADIPLGVIVSSHLQRAYETAETIATFHPTAKRIVMENFGEMRFGEFEGMHIRGPESTPHTRERLQSIRKHVLQDKNFPFPGGGESASQVETRAVNGLEEVLEKYPNEDHIAIVAHGRMNRFLLSSLLQTDLNAIEQGNVCVNVLDVDKEGSWKSIVLNYVNHINDTQLTGT